MTHLIAHEYTHIAQFEILYGGFWRSAKLIKALSGLEPLWIMEGMAENVSHSVLNREWSSYDKMILRDAVLYDYLYNLRQLQNFNALYRNVYLGYKEGHSAIDYLVEKEGPEVNFRLLKALRNNIDPVKAFETASHNFASLKDFDVKWRKNLKNEVTDFVKDKDKIYEKSEAMVSDKFHSRNPVPDEKGNFYYISDRWLINEIYYRTPQKEIKILPGFFGSDVKLIVTGRNFDRIIDYSPVKKELVFFAKRKQKYFLYIYNTETKALRKKKISVSEPRSPSFSKNGNKIVFTGLKNSRRNIYIYDTATGETSRVTDDSFVDFAPVFSEDDSKIISAAERDYQTDIRIIDLNDLSAEWLTETPYNEIQPFVKNGILYYSADRNSVYNIYQYDLANSTFSAITNIRGGLFYPSVDSNGEILCSAYYKNSFKIVKFKGGKNEYHLEQTKTYSNFNSTFTLAGGILEKRPYSFRFSTDFFLPSFVYSTEFGLIGGGYYKASDMLGRHDFNLMGWAWLNEYQITGEYTLKKWRPDLFLSMSFTGENYLELNSSDETEEIHESEQAAVIGMNYPLNSFERINSWITAANENYKNMDTKESGRTLETGFGIGFERITAMLEPFHAVRGSVFSLSAYAARPVAENGINYNRYESQIKKYIPVGRRLTFAGRLFLGRYEGEDADYYKLNSGGYSYLVKPYALRGYPSGTFYGQNIGALSSEIRYLLFPDIGWHIYFMWPDINIYSLSVKAFTDAGTCFYDDIIPDSQDDIGLSGGFGLKLNLYLLQLAPIYVNFDIAKPYDSDKWKTYWTFSSGYITW